MSVCVVVCVVACVDDPANSCLWAFDGFCDGLPLCQVGTDTADCAAAANFSHLDFSPFDFDGNITCGSTVFGTTDAAGSHVGDISGDHVYYFEVAAPGVGNVRFNSCGSQMDTLLRVRSHNMTHEYAWCDECCTACPCGVKAVVDSGPLAPGSYAMVIEGYGSAEGNYTVEMSCQSLNFTLELDRNISCGSFVSGDSSLSVGNELVEHIYPFTVGRTGVANIVFDSCNSEFDTVLKLTQYPDVSEVLLTADDDGACLECLECVLKDCHRFYLIIIWRPVFGPL
jgi:hypothetical protein